MPRVSKSQFNECINNQGTAIYKLPLTHSDVWNKLSIDQKNEFATDDHVEDGWQLTDISYAEKEQDNGMLDITVTADASNWNCNEE